jgi:hypothetical protein
MRVVGAVETALKRFWSKVDVTGDCWLWMASLGTAGYGQFAYRGRMRGAHRVAWELTHGPIPDGLFVRHICDTKLCVRPDHLELGTQAENVRDMHKRGRWHYIPSGQGKRDRLREQARQAPNKKRGVPPKPLPDLIWPKVLKTGGCWQWQGQTTRRGYGVQWDGKEKRLVHRLVYEMLVGPIPEGLHVHHKCENHACVNPEHMRLVDPSVHTSEIHPNNARSNWQRMRGRTHCSKGHELTSENTRIKIRHEGSVSRICRICQRDDQRSRYLSKRGR